MNNESEINLEININSVSKLHKITCCEPITRRGINSVLNDPTSCINHQTICRQLLKELNRSGILKQQYFSTKGDPWSRVYSGANSLQRLSKQLRKSLCDPNKLVEIDTKCSNPTILRNICISNDIDCPTLTDYCSCPANFLQELNNHHDCKKIVPIIINGGSFSLWANSNDYKGFAPDWIKKISLEIENITTKLVECNPKLIPMKQYNADGTENKNVKGSVMASILFYHEAEILYRVFMYLKKKQIIDDNNECVLIHDGILVKQHPEINENLLKELSDHVLQTTNFSMQFHLKPLEEGSTVHQHSNHSFSSDFVIVDDSNVNEVDDEESDEDSDEDSDNDSYDSRHQPPDANLEDLYTPDMADSEISNDETVQNKTQPPPGTVPKNVHEVVVSVKCPPKFEHYKKMLILRRVFQQLYQTKMCVANAEFHYERDKSQCTIELVMRGGKFHPNLYPFLDNSVKLIQKAVYEKCGVKVAIVWMICSRTIFVPAENKKNTKTSSIDSSNNNCTAKNGGAVKKTNNQNDSSDNSNNNTNRYDVPGKDVLMNSDDIYSVKSANTNDNNIHNKNIRKNDGNANVHNNNNTLSTDNSNNVTNNINNEKDVPPNNNHNTNNPNNLSSQTSTTSSRIAVQSQYCSQRSRRKKTRKRTFSQTSPIYHSNKQQRKRRKYNSKNVSRHGNKYNRQKPKKKSKKKKKRNSKEEYDSDDENSTVLGSFSQQLSQRLDDINNSEGSHKNDESDIELVNDAIFVPDSSNDVSSEDAESNHIRNHNREDKIWNYSDEYKPAVSDPTSFRDITQCIKELNYEQINFNEYQQIFDEPIDQIDPEASNYNEIKQWVEQRGCHKKGFIKICNPCCIYNKYHKSSLNFTEIRNLLQCVKYKCIETEKDGRLVVKVKDFVPQWLNDSSAYTKQSYCWVPPPITEMKGKNLKNLWNTFDKEKYHKIVSMGYSGVDFSVRYDLKTDLYPNILVHFMVKIICSKRKIAIQYWIAYIYQTVIYPGVNPQIVNLLYSKAQGTGKNSWCSIIQALMGNMYFYETSGTDFLKKGNFTGNTEYIVIVVNEICEAMIKQSDIERIKAKTTNLKVPVNKKFEKITEHINTHRLIITLNDKTMAGIGRRFAIWQLNEEKTQDDKYFKELREARRDPKKLKVLWDWMMYVFDEKYKRAIMENRFSFSKLYNSMKENHIQDQIDFKNTEITLKFFGIILAHILEKKEFKETSKRMKYQYIVFAPNIVRDMYRSFNQRCGKGGRKPVPDNLHAITSAVEDVKDPLTEKPSVVWIRHKGKRYIYINVPVFLQWVGIQSPGLMNQCQELKDMYIEKKEIEGRYQWTDRTFFKIQRKRGSSSK